MKTVPVHEAKGMVLVHDLTQIIPGEFKGPAFRKGHIVTGDDIPRLLDMGKQNLFVYDLECGLVHEDDAAMRIATAAAGNGVRLEGPREGKVELVAAQTGLLKVDADLLYAINDITDVMMATIHSNQPVEPGKVLAGTRVIPLVVPEEKVAEIEDICAVSGPLVRVAPYRALRAGIVTTGSEVYTGRITDKFGPVVRDKLEKYGSSVMRQTLVSDSAKDVAAEITRLVTEGAGLVTVTGGMSVDPDDVSPLGIRLSGAEVVTYGAPILPGAMFMLAYLGDIPVMGLPGCVMYNRISIFDLVLPRVLAGERLTRRDIIDLAQGGLCLNCAECRYPDCGFGKGAS
jgi:hypothetical protein